jgi:hypothetical protein
VRKTQRPSTGDAGPKLERLKPQEFDPSSEIAKPAQALLNEQQIQRAVFQNIRARSAPGVFAFHPANGGYRRPIEAKILHGLGVTSGVPDVIAIKDGRCYALELKRAGGRVSEAQLACLAAMQRAGAFTAVAEGLDRALACLEGWGLLRGRSS